MALKFIEQKTSKKFTRRELLIGFTALLAVLVSLVFPQTAYGETFWLSFFLFAVFPALTVVFLLKEPLKNFGLTLGKRRTGIIFSAVALIIFIFANYFLVFHSKYAGQLSIPPFIINSFAAFLAFEIFISLPLHFFWEVFFRGFIQMGLEKKLGIFSLLLAAVLQIGPMQQPVRIKGVVDATPSARVESETDIGTALRNGGADLRLLLGR